MTDTTQTVQTGITARRCLTLEEASEYTTASIQTIRRAIKRKLLRAYKPGRRVMLHPDELDRWLRESAVGAEEA
jgi:excisionase family DNA binding protein